MKFRLTYEGPLLADNNRGGRTPGRAAEKQRIRKHFHTQLKRLWDLHPILNPDIGPRAPLVMTAGSRNSEVLPHDMSSLAGRFASNGYRYIPLATRNLGLTVSLDILFLRADPPGTIIHAGDIDNRIKTLVDGLKMPRDKGELGPFTSPEEGEDPFFVLMEDDSLISRLTVETDTLLEPVKGQVSDARVVVTVGVTPYSTTIANVHFGG